MPLIFPNNPTLNSTTSTGGKFWIWDGESWMPYSGLGYSGSRGNTGFVGSEGDIGYSGSVGFVGSASTASGYSGSVGYAGSQGNIGFVGSAGYIGQDGYTGSKGEIGYTGSQGDIGYTGSQGNIGFVGSIGIGYTGSGSGSISVSTSTPSPVSMGSLWFDSDTGKLRIYYDTTWVEIVSTGETGFSGSQGNTGFVGSAGYIGQDGYTGSKGEIGYTGSRGDTGFVGSQGDTGFVGSIGIGYTGSGSGSISVSTSTPSPVSMGSLWFDSDTGKLRIYYDNTWVGVLSTGARGYTGSSGYVGSGGNVGYTGSSSGSSITAIYNTATTSTGYFALPIGDTNQRPANPSSGFMRYNSTLNQAEIYNAVDGLWAPFNTPKGTLSNPVRSSSDLTNLTTGPIYILPNGYAGAAFQTYLDNTTIGGGWLLAFVVTNLSNSDLDWFAGDSSFPGYSGTDYFTSLNSILNIGTMSALNKQNSKNPLMDYWATGSIMIREDYQGTVGYKAYALSTSKTFYARFTDGTNPVDNDQSYNNQVNSIIGTSGIMGATFTTNTLDFNYTLLNDGARIAATSVSSEATGGVSARVDQSRGYSWKGNLTRSDAGRQYGVSGITSDHTVWFFVR